MTASPSRVAAASTPRDENARTRLPVLPLLLGLALVLRLLWWLRFPRAIESEGVDYSRIAETWFHGEGYHGVQGGPNIQFPPFYPALIGLFTFVVRDSELAERLVSLTAGLAFVALVYIVTRHVFGALEGAVAGLVAATHPLLVALSVTTYVESLVFFLVLSTLWLAMRARATGHWLYALASGAVIGLAYLSRPEYIFFAPLLALFLAYFRLRGGAGFAAALRHGAAAAVATAVVALPYVVHLSSMAGRFRWEGKTATVEIVNERLGTGMPYPRAVRGLDVVDDFATKAPYLGGPELLGDQSVYLRAGPRAGHGLANLIAAIPRRIPGVLKYEVHAIYGWTSVWKIPVGLVAILLGVFVTRWWQRETRDDALLLLGFATLQCAVPLGIVYLWPRFAFPFVTHAIPWLASGLVWLGRTAFGALSGARLHVTRWTAIGSSLLVAAIAVTSVRRVEFLEDFYQATDPTPKEVGLWLRGQTPSHEGRLRPIVMGCGAIIPYYVDGVLAYLPPIDDESVALRFVHWQSPDFIVLRSKELGQGEYLRPWFDRGIRDACAVPILQKDAETGAVRVWRWTCQN